MKRFINSCRFVAGGALLFLFALTMAGCIKFEVKNETGPLRITDNPNEEMEPQWSPDGKMLSYGSGIPGNQNVFVVDMETLEEAQNYAGLGFCSFNNLVTRR